MEKWSQSFRDAGEAILETRDRERTEAKRTEPSAVRHARVSESGRNCIWSVPFMACSSGRRNDARWSPV